MASYVLKSLPYKDRLKACNISIYTNDVCNVGNAPSAVLAVPFCCCSSKDGWTVGRTQRLTQHVLCCCCCCHQPPHPAGRSAYSEDAVSSLTGDAPKTSVIFYIAAMEIAEHVVRYSTDDVSGTTPRAVRRDFSIFVTQHCHHPPVPRLMTTQEYVAVVCQLILLTVSVVLPTAADTTRPSHSGSDGRRMTG